MELLLLTKKNKLLVNRVKNKDTKLITYGPQSDYKIESIKTENNNSTISIHCPNRNITIETTLIGQFNFENILAAVTLSDHLKISIDVIQSAIKKYQGIKRRLELIFNKKNLYIYDDFAQSAPRIKSTITAIKNQFPEHKIIVYFEAHASFLQTKNGLTGFEKCFIGADKVILGKIHFDPKVAKENRVTASDYKNTIGERLQYVPLEEDIINILTGISDNKTVIINMSSGGLKNHQILTSVINRLKGKNV